ncbi:TonB-dependent receptor plug domain-containing protein [Lonepinella sp. MS14437]|uniref:TonB-dependent receptor plug domain-containing protein n=1 Tax=Lonepinella sp. MS14437 TaxID=3003620 RepID=UPI0036DD1A2A
MRKFTYSILATSIWAALTLPVMAEENTVVSPEQASDTAETLDTIVVSGTSFSQQMGTQTITAEKIKHTPIRNSHITELLRTNPNVQFSNTADSANNAGDIKPNEVSFHGEKYWENNFIIDGMSNNDNLNPGADARSIDTNNPYDLPDGNSQSLWIDPSLLKTVEVFDSNISAKYGNFTGGVINAELKDPNLERPEGRVYYRTTHSAWADYYVSGDTSNNRYLNIHQHYVKHSYGFVASTPLSDNVAITLAYDRTTSDIDYYHTELVYADGSRVPSHQKRVNETFLLRGIYLPNNGDLWRATLIYSPHKAEKPRDNVVNGRYTNTGGGVQGSIEWEKEFSNLKMKTHIGYKKTGDEVENDSADYSRYSLEFSDDYLYEKTYGGYGRVYTQKESFTAKQDFTVNEFDWGPTNHKISFGWAAEKSKAQYKRDIATTEYYYVSNPAVVCNGAEQCIDGSQYARNKQYFYTRNVKASDDDYGAYIQDQITWGRLETNLGLRVDYNKFYGNTSLAHRLSASYDIFGDKETQVFTGLNRYYARSNLSYKLREGIMGRETYRRSYNGTNSDGSLGEWALYSSGDVNVPRMMNKVKTPYNDEIVLGFNQKLWGNDLTFKWVHRNGRDQLTSQQRIINGKAYYVLVNDGTSSNNTYSLTFSSPEAYKLGSMELGWSIAGSIYRYKNNNRHYDASASDTYAKAIYNEQLYDSSELPPADFNAPWKVIGTITTKFPSINLSWDHTLSYQGKKTQMTTQNNTSYCNGANSTSASLRRICGDYVGEAVNYYDETIAGHFNLDWRFTYSLPIKNTQYLELTLDVNNVLNKQVPVSTRANSNAKPVWRMGRNFWLGVSYNW